MNRACLGNKNKLETPELRTYGYADNGCKTIKIYGDQIVNTIDYFIF